MVPQKLLEPRQILDCVVLVYSLELGGVRYDSIHFAHIFRMLHDHYRVALVRFGDNEIVGLALLFYLLEYSMCVSTEFSISSLGEVEVLSLKEN